MRVPTVTGSEPKDGAPLALAWWRESVDVVSRSAAVLIACLYGSGFLVVNIRNGQYGYANFDLIGPKVLAAGVLFAVSCAIAVAVERLFSEAKDDTVAKSVELFCLHVVAMVGLVRYGLAALFGFMIDGDLGPAVWYSTAGIALMLVMRKWGSRVGCLHSLLLPFGLVLFLIGEGADNWAAVSVGLWFVVCGRGIQWIREEPILMLEWRNVTFAIVVIVWFAEGFYGRVLPKFGGGAQIRATVHVRTPIPASTETALNAVIVDENQYGLFVLLVPDGSKYSPGRVSEVKGGAVLVPRENIVTVMFVDPRPRPRETDGTIRISLLFFRQSAQGCGAGWRPPQPCP